MPQNIIHCGWRGNLHQHADLFCYYMFFEIINSLKKWICHMSILSHSPFGWMYNSYFVELWFLLSWVMLNGETQYSGKSNDLKPGRTITIIHLTLCTTYNSILPSPSNLWLKQAIYFRKISTILVSCREPESMGQCIKHFSKENGNQQQT